MHNELYKHRSPKVYWDGFFSYLNIQKPIKIVKAVHLLPKTNKWDYLRSPIIDFFFIPCFDIGEVPRSPWKWNWNWLYFLPFIFTFEQCGAPMNQGSCYVRRDN